VDGGKQGIGYYPAGASRLNCDRRKKEIHCESIGPLSLEYKDYRLKTTGKNEEGRFGSFEPGLCLFADRKKGEHDVFQNREGRLMYHQRKLLRTGLRNEPMLGFLVQLYGRVISLCLISNEGKGRPDLELVVLGFPYVLLVVRPYERTGPRVERFVNQLDAEGKATHSPNAPPMCSRCKNILNGITLFPIFTTEGRVLCQSICATHPPEPPSLVSELEEEALWSFPGFHNLVCPPMNLDSV